MSAATVLWLLLGFTLLVGGGETLVRGGSGLGRTMGLSPLVVGLTVVAFATSAPELAVSVGASLSGAPGLAVGNVVGSNITNVLLVLGVAAVVLPVAVRSQLVRIDVPVMVMFSALLPVLSLDGNVSRAEGTVLVVLLLGYVGWSVWTGRTEVPDEWEPKAEQVPPPAGRGWLSDLGTVAAGVVMLVVGAHLMVDAATRVAAAVGVSNLVIGLTVVSIGTSLPELATAVIAALRGERELAIGNVVGSCVCNIGLVMGVTAMVARVGVPVDLAAVRFDMPVMVAVAAALLPVVFTGFVITRAEAAVFLAYYVVYVAYLLLDAADHDALPAFSATLLWFVIPITVLTWTLLSLHQLTDRRSDRSSKGK